MTILQAAIRSGLAAITFFALAVPSLAETLVLGSVSDDIRKHHERFAPLVAYLEDRLADDGITQVEVAVLPDSASMADALSDGSVDLYFDSPLVGAHVARQAGAEPFLRRWKNGEAAYHAVLVVRADSNMVSLTDVLGSTVGFQDPDSTSGFMLPVALLKSFDLTVRELPNANTPVNEDEVGYVFTGDDLNTVAWLARGLIDVAATDPRGFQWLDEARPDQFRILARSIDVPRQIIVRRSDLDPYLAARLAIELQDMANSEIGLAAMEAFNQTSRFDLFPEGIDATFDPIYQRLDQLERSGLI